MLVNLKTIIFITIYPFNEDYALKYGFDIFKQRGYNVIIINVFEFIFSDDVKQSKAFPCHLMSVNSVEQICVKSGDELEIRLQNIQGWKRAVLVVYPYLQLLRILTKADVKYLRTFTNIQPPCSKNKTTYCRRLIRALKRFADNPIAFFSTTVLYRIPYSLLNLDYPEYVVFGSAVTNYVAHPKTKVIYSHSFDYDRYLRNKDKIRPKYIPDKPYFVYIPVMPWGGSGGSDYAFLGLRSVISKKTFSSLINTFMDFVEKETGKQVLIAAHPKSNNDDNIYMHRKFLKNDSEQLIKYSEGVFCHYSGAIKFAVIHRKPMCFISTRQLKNDLYFQQNLYAYASRLKARVHYIDCLSDLEQLISGNIFCIDSTAYNSYMQDYICNNCSEERLLWNTVIDELETNYIFK